MIRKLTHGVLELSLIYCFVDDHLSLEQTKKKFDILATIGIKVLSEPTPDANLDIGSMNRSNLLRQLTQFMDSRQQPINYETSNSKYLHHFIKVSTKVNDPLYLNLCEGMKKLFGIGEKGQVMQNLVEYLLDNHEDEVKAALREKKVIPRRMSVYETAVMMDKANLLGTNLRALTQCMMCFMDIDKRLWADENEIRELGSHCVLPIVDVYHHPVSDKEDALREKIRFWYKETAEMFVRSAQSLIDGIQDFDPKKVNFIHSCLGADHATKGVGKMRVVSK